MRIDPMYSALKRHVSRRGVAMVVVMVAVAVVFVIGMSLLASLPATARASSNVIDRDAAVYIAESGLVEALQRLENSPEGESVWSGVTGRSVEGLDGTYDVAIADLGEGEYRVNATGHATGRSGLTLSRTVSMTVEVIDSAASYKATKSAVFNTGYLPSAATVKGDVHVNSQATSLGKVEGTLSSTSWVFSLPGKADDTEPYADPVDMPEVDSAAYMNYSYGAGSYSAEVYSDDEIENLPEEVEATGPANPLGVVVVDGDLQLQDDLKVRQSILVVRGNLDLNGHKLEVKGNDDLDQLTLIVDGEVVFRGNQPELKVEKAPAFIGDRIRTIGTNSAKLEAKQGLFAHEGLPLFFGGDVDIDYEDVRANGSSTFRYFGDGGTQQDRTVSVLNYSQKSTD